MCSLFPWQHGISYLFKLLLYSFDSVDMSDIKGLSDAVGVLEFVADIGYKKNFQCIRITKFPRQSFKTKHSRAFVDNGINMFPGREFAVQNDT
jgi:hypothetical protein